MKKKTALVLAFLLLFALALTGCGSSTDSNAGTMVPGGAENVYSSQKESAGGFAGETADSPNEDSAVYTESDAKIIRTAEMTIQTTEFDQAMANLSELTAELGGYYESARADGGGYYDRNANRTADYVVRIPKENYTAFLDKAGKVGHLYSVSEESKDVGEVYYDTETRLATLKTKQERLLALLEEADVMEDIISLENALADVQYEIDMNTTTLRRYDSLIDYSTFHISLIEVVKISTEPTPEDSFLTKLGAAFSAGLEGFGNGLQSFALWLVRNIFVLIILAVIVVAVLRIVFWRRKKRRDPPSGS